MKRSPNAETTRIETPRASVPRPTSRLVADDEAKTQFFVVPSKRVDDSARVDEPRRARNSFPEPPRNRPRVFDRPAQADVTTLRPSCVGGDERTQLRPQIHEPLAGRVRPEPRVAASESSVVVAPEIAQPIPTRSSIPPASYSVPAIETTVELPAFKRMSPIRIAALSMAAVVAPFLCVVMLLGSADPPVSRAAAATAPAVAQAISLIATAPAPAPAAVSVPVAPTPAPEPKRPPPVAVAAYHASVAPPSVATAPFAGAIAPAAAAAPRPVARVAAPPVVAAAKPKTKTVTTELPDAQAADALARAQLEAALR